MEHKQKHVTRHHSWNRYEKRVASLTSFRDWTWERKKCCDQASWQLTQRCEICGRIHDMTGIVTRLRGPKTFTMIVRDTTDIITISGGELWERFLGKKKYETRKIWNIAAEAHKVTWDWENGEKGDSQHKSEQTECRKLRRVLYRVFWQVFWKRKENPSHMSAQDFERGEKLRYCNSTRDTGLRGHKKAWDSEPKATATGHDDMCCIFQRHLRATTDWWYDTSKLTTRRKHELWADYRV